MTKQTKRWVTFMAPGLIVGESWSVNVDHCDPNKVEWADGAYAFTMHEREDVVIDGTLYTGKPKQIGPTYYHPDSKVETIDEVSVNPKRGPCLLQNMKCNGWDKIVWSRWGNWPQPFDEKTSAILPIVSA